MTVLKKIIRKLKGKSRSFFSFFEFMGDLSQFKKLSSDGRFVISWRDLYPCLKDKTSITSFDRHYVYHPAWAAALIKSKNPTKHVDISSSLHFSSMLAAFVPTEFLDYRPARLELKNFKSTAGDLLKLPFIDDSIESLSCMHVIEHVGLGRYGDPIDPHGDIKAIKELQRVVAIGGYLYFVVPLGAKARVCFNAHRVYSKEAVLREFPQEFELREFCLIPENEVDGGLVVNPSSDLLDRQRYGCGCFLFQKIRPLRLP